MNTSQYCKTLDNVTREELVNALHQSLMQLQAARVEHASPPDRPYLNHTPAITEASRIMVKAGHIGFPIPEPVKRADFVTIDAKAKTGKRSTFTS